MASKKPKTKSAPPQGKAFTWQVHGVCQSKADQTPPSDLISVQEEVSMLKWKTRPRKPQKPVAASPAKGSFGRPIDINVAIDIIGTGYAQAKHHFIGEGRDKTNPMIEDILRLNYGVTFDKSVILKILSQPNCEGLRSYLCYRKEKDHYSLVMLGVDKDGYDLNYYPKPINGKAEGGGTVDNSGLLVEYGHPPGIVDFAEDKIDDHYVVLKYCNLAGDNNK